MNSRIDQFGSSDMEDIEEEDEDIVAATISRIEREYSEEEEEEGLLERLQEEKLFRACKSGDQNRLVEVLKGCNNDVSERSFHN